MKPYGLSFVFLTSSLVAVQASAQWRKFPRVLQQISVGNGDHVWALENPRAPRIVRWNKPAQDWEEVSGPPNETPHHVSAGADGEVWIVTKARRVFRWTGNGWEPRAPGESMFLVSVGTKNHIWGLRWGDVPGGKQAARWNGSGWDNKPGGLQHLSVGADGEVWGVNAAHSIFRWAGEAFVLVGGRLRQISVGSRDQIWGSTVEGELFRYSSKQGWQRLGGMVRYVSAGADGTVRALPQDLTLQTVGLEPDDALMPLDAQLTVAAPRPIPEKFDIELAIDLAGCRFGAGASVGVPPKLGLIGLECIKGKLASVARAVGKGIDGLKDWALEKLKDVPPFSYVLKVKGFIEALARECGKGELPGCILTALKEALGPVGNAIEFAAKFAGKVREKGIGGALDEVRKGIVERIERELAGVKERVARAFQAFRRVLEAETLNLSDVKAFAGEVFRQTNGLVTEFNQKLGAPGFMSGAVSDLVSAGITAAVTAAATPIAATYHGLRKLMTLLIPEIIVGGGKAYEFVKELPERLLKMLPPELQSLAAPLVRKAQEVAGSVLRLARGAIRAPLGQAVPGALVELLVRDPKKKEKLKRFLGKVADFSDRLAQGITKVTQALRERSLAKMATVIDEEAGVADEPKGVAPKEPRPVDLQALLPALKDFLKDEIWAALQPRLRDLLGKGLSLLDGLVDVPRNALVAAVGTIPLAGGVLSSALNYGLGFIVGNVKDLLTQQVMDLADKALQDTLAKVEAALQRKLEEKGGEQAGASFLKLIAFLRETAEAVSKVARAGARGFKGSLGALVTAALNELLLSGIADTGLRQIVANAIDAVVQGIAEGRKLNFKAALAAVLEKIAQPLASFVAKRLPEEFRALAPPVSEGLSAVLTALAKDPDRALKDPLGFLTEAGRNFVGDEKNRRKLASALISAMAWMVNDSKARQAIEGLGPKLAPLVEKGLSALHKTGFDVTKIGEVLSPVLARLFFEGFVLLLEQGAGRAEPLLKTLVAWLRVDDALAKPVLAAVGAGARTLVGEAKKCGAAISNRETAVGVFHCLKLALGAAGKAGAVAGAKEIFDQFLQLLEKLVAGGAGRLEEVSAALNRFASKVGLSVDLDLGGLLGGAGRAFLGRARACGAAVTGIDAATAKAVLGCLRDGLIATAEDLILGALPEEARAARAEAMKAIAELLRRPALPKSPLSGGFRKPSIKQVAIAVLKRLAGPLGDFVAQLVRSKARALVAKFPELPGTAREGVKKALENLDKPPTGKSSFKDLKERFLQNPSGFLRELARDLVIRHKEKLADVVVGQLVSVAPILEGARRAVARQIVGAITTLEKEGFELGTIHEVLGSLVAKACFHGLIEVLKKGAEEARRLAGKLKDTLAAVPPREIGTVMESLATGLGEGAKEFVTQAQRCGPAFAGFNREAATGLFNCLAQALRAGAGAAVAASAVGLFDQILAALLGALPDEEAGRKLSRDLPAMVKAVLQGKRPPQELLSDALKKIAEPVGEAVAASIRKRGSKLAGPVKAVIAKLLGSAASALSPPAVGPAGKVPAAAASGRKLLEDLLRNPIAFLAERAKRFLAVEQNRKWLSDQLARIAPEALRRPVATAASRMLGHLAQEGFSPTRAIEVLSGVAALALFDAFLEVAAGPKAAEGAKRLLQALASQVSAIFGEARLVAEVLEKGFGEGKSLAVAEARKCRPGGKPFNRESAVGLLSCLALALRTSAGAAADAAARAAFDRLMAALVAGMPDPKQRRDLEAQTESLAKRISWDRISRSKEGMAALLKEIATPAGRLVAAPIRDRKLQDAVAKGVAASLTALAAPKGAGPANAVPLGARLLNPHGFLGELAKDFVRRNRSVLAGAIVALAGTLTPAPRSAVRQAVERLLTAIGETSFSLANAVAVLNGIVPQAMFDAFIGLLERRQPEAATLVKKLADQLARSFPAAKAAATSLSKVAGAAMQKSLQEAKRCRSALTGFNRESAVGVLGCLSFAFQSGKGVAEKALARGLFDAFVQELERKAGRPEAALAKLASEMSKFFPGVRSLADRAVRAFHRGVKQAAAEARACGAGITGFNEGSARAVLNCLALAFRAASDLANRATRGSVRGLFDEFVKALRSDVSGAQSRLRRLAERLAQVASPVTGLAGQVVSSVRKASDRIARDASVCRATLSGLNAESATGVFGCLQLALRTPAGAGQAGATAAKAGAAPGKGGAPSKKQPGKQTTKSAAKKSSPREPKRKSPRKKRTKRSSTR